MDDDHDEDFAGQSAPPPVMPPTTRRHASHAIEPPQDKSEKLEEWMMTYMDTVTLLVTLFALMLSFSSISEEKTEALVEGLRLDKYGVGILFGTAGVMDKARSTVPAKPDARTPPVAPPAAEPAEPALDNKALDGIQKLLAQQGISDSVEAKITDSLLDLQLRDSVLFESGQATLLSGGYDVLSRLIPLLQKGAFQISVEGHTDSVPISTDYYPSNWELSGARAAAVVRALIDLGIAADRLQTIGHAHTKPVADNTSEEGRKKNRRVNLILNIDAKSASHLLEQ